MYFSLAASRLMASNGSADFNEFFAIWCDRLAEDLLLCELWPNLPR